MFYISISEAVSTKVDANHFHLQPKSVSARKSVVKMWHDVILVQASQGCNGNTHNTTSFPDLQSKAMGISNFKSIIYLLKEVSTFCHPKGGAQMCRTAKFVGSPLVVGKTIATHF